MPSYEGFSGYGPCMMSERKWRPGKGPGGPKVNKFEQVQVVVTWEPLSPVKRQTDTTENITSRNFVS